MGQLNKRSKVFPPAGAKSALLRLLFCLWRKRSHPPAPLLLLFRKRARSARLLGCKRPRDGSLSLPPFCGCLRSKLTASANQVLDEHLLFCRWLCREMFNLIPKQKTPSWICSKAAFCYICNRHIRIIFCSLVK